MSEFNMIDAPGVPQVTSIEYEMTCEHDWDSSPRDYLFQDPEYQEQDQERLEAWERGDWSFIGIQAKATIRVPAGGTSFAIYTLTSPGLWSVEDDSGEEYLNSIFEEEKAALSEALVQIGQAAGGSNV